MILKEFFGKSIDPQKSIKNKDISDTIGDDLFWYILDHDKLHKDYFFPIAKKVKKLKECGPEMVLELYMPMVVKGCKEYYHAKKMEGRMSKCFPKELRETLCQRLHDHYHQDILKGKYKIG